MVAWDQIWCRSRLVDMFMPVLVLGAVAKVLEVVEVLVGALLPVTFLPKIASNSVKFLLGFLPCRGGGFRGGRVSCRMGFFLVLGGWYLLVDF